MKLKDVIISEANGQKIAVSVGGSFNGMLKLNDTAAFIADLLQQETTIEEVAQKLCEAYETDMETAIKSVESVAEQFRKVGLIEE
ncbi:MAG: PqqD family protein [Ruminococcaceae bacterium]|nr:PqqD family protein [Oscillospiraceae bacterium]